MTTTLDIAALVEAVALPVVLLVALVWFREPIAAVLKELPKRVESISIGAVSIKLAAAKPGALVGPGGAVDLRKAGTPGDVNDSTLRSFYTQIEDPSRIDYAVVDLDTGMSWLSSRLYILSIILRRMRGLQAVVFVGTVGTTTRRFIGVCPAEVVRWRLAARWPRFESALAAAELQVWGHPYQQIPVQVPIPLQVVAPPGEQPPVVPVYNLAAQVVNDEGRLEYTYSTSEGAVTLLRAFLVAIQRQPLPAPEPDWAELPGTQPVREEYATWLNRDLLEDVMGRALDQRSIRLADMQGWSDELRTRAVLEHPGNWIAITRDDFVFDYLVDRRRALDLAVTPAS